MDEVGTRTQSYNTQYTPVGSILCLSHSNCTAVANIQKRGYFNAVGER